MRPSLLHAIAIIWLLLPPTRLFRLKRMMLRAAGATVGPGVRFVSSVRVHLSGDLDVGAQTFVGHDVLFVGGNALIRIGAFCDIAPRVVFASGTHEISLAGERAGGRGRSLPIDIGAGCWICAGSIILGGTNIGAHSIVAAGAVVKGTFPAHSLIGGVPARVLRPLAVSTGVPGKEA